MGQLQRDGGPWALQWAQTDEAQILPQQRGRQSLKSFVVHMAFRQLPLEVLGGGLERSQGIRGSEYVCAHVCSSEHECGTMCIWGRNLGIWACEQVRICVCIVVTMMSYDWRYQKVDVFLCICVYKRVHIRVYMCAHVHSCLRLHWGGLEWHCVYESL